VFDKISTFAKTLAMDNFRISRLEINEIGPFGHLTIDFPEKPAGMADRAEVHILTGENGTGKTTVLEMLAAAYGAELRQSWLPDKRRTDTSQFTVKDSEGSIACDAAGLSKYGPDRFKTKNYPNKFPTENFKPYSVAFFAYSGHRQLSAFPITGIQELTGHPFEGALNFSGVTDSTLMLQWLANTIASEAIAQTQGNAQEAREYRATISQAESILSKIVDKEIKFTLETRPFGVKIRVENETLDFNLLPDGLKSIVSWIADLLMRMDRVKWENDTPVFERNFVLFLDEIEVHLHPAWQRKILPAVQGLFPNAQIFISTHSPFVVGSVDGAWIHKFVKPNGDSQLAGPPILSEDALSFHYWLGEVFDIKKEFGEGAERQLAEFYRLRDSLLVNGTPVEREQFVKLAGDLNRQSRDMAFIISSELRQFNKRVQHPVEI